MHRLLSLWLLLFPLAAAPGPPLAAEAEPSPADDAFHYASWADGLHDGAYTEWWYFNFSDPLHRLQGIVSYFVTNPGNVLGGARVQMVAVAYTPDGTVEAIDAYPIASFAAGTDRADVTCGDNTVHADDDGSLRIAGASRDGRLSWDLSYGADATPWYAAERMPIGRLAWESMSWLVAMPRAEVSGRMIVDGRSYVVHAPGYHDHNWGEWLPTDALWNWAQYSDRGLAFEMGDFIGQPAGLVSVERDGVRTVFTPDQYRLVHTRWARDEVNGGYYPVESRLLADDGHRRLRLTLRAVATVPLRGDLPVPLGSVVIYEQTARFDGRLLERDPEGRWRVAAHLRGTGFKEYTAKRF
jgi:hypothetical protein